jgi:hypothetical protein
MSKISEDKLKDALDTSSSIWLDFLEKQYDERWWDALKMILKRSLQPSMDENKAYQAGLIWVAVFDLGAAMGNRQFKNPDLLPFYAKAISQRHKVDFKVIWNLLTSIPDGVLPHKIYISIYQTLDHNYKPVQEESKDSIDGFVVFMRKMMESSYLGSLLTGEWKK